MSVAQPYLDEVVIEATNGRYCDIVTSSVTDKFFYQSDNVIVGKRYPKATSLTITGKSLFGTVSTTLNVPAKLSMPNFYNASSVREERKNQFLERLWTFLKIKQTLYDLPNNLLRTKVKCPDTKANAFYLAKKYNFVTNSTSLVLTTDDISEKEAEPDDLGLARSDGYEMKVGGFIESCVGSIKLFARSDIQGEGKKIWESAELLPSDASYAASFEITGESSIHHVCVFNASFKCSGH